MKQLYIHGGKAYLILKRTWEGHFSPKLDQLPDMDYCIGVLAKNVWNFSDSCLIYDNEIYDLNNIIYYIKM
jgi:hypothetical protein